MRIASIAAIVLALLSASLVAQEEKPVPKDSMRVTIPGCTKGYIFTAGPRTEEQPGSLDVPEGLHLRMNGPRKLMAEIKAHEGSVIVITGLMKKGQFLPGGVGIGGGVRVSPGPGPGGFQVSAGAGQVFIDVEGWRAGVGTCPTPR
jgi:hypothetical protein